MRKKLISAIITCSLVLTAFVTVPALGAELVKDSETGEWLYTVDGEPDYSYTGFASNDNGDWYVKDGVITFNSNGVLKDADGAIGDAGAWYLVLESKVPTSFNGLAKNSNGWWYIKGGKVQFSFTGTVIGDGTEYTVNKGKVDM